MSEEVAAVIPAEFEDLFHGSALAQLGTLRSDGTPHLTPIWIDLEGDRLLVNTRVDRVKAKHMQQRPDVAVCIVDPADPYRYITVTGVVDSVEEADAMAHMDRLAARYLRVSKYPWAKPGELRLVFRVRPTRVSFDRGGADVPEPEF
jgi:PPOX class probable F420-dependent enzyme